MYQKGNRLFFILVITMLALTLYFVPYSHAMEIKGKVVKVDGDAITILLEGKMMPMEGDIATLFFEHEQLGEMQIGEWKITKVTYPTASAVKIDATGDAREGGKAVIQSQNPAPVLDSKTNDSIKRPVPVKNSYDEALIDAADKGNLEAVMQAINNGANPNAARDTGETALFAAVIKGHRDIVAALLKAGSDPNIEGLKGRFALGLASVTGHDDIVRLLVENNAKVNYQIHSGELEFSEGATALCMAAKRNHGKTVELLLSLGADPLLEDSKGFNALGYAVESRWVEMVNLLLEKGISPGKSILTGVTPLHIAASSFAPWEIYTQLVGAGADTNAKMLDTDLLPISHHGVTPLIIASGDTHEEMVLFLLLTGADPYIKDSAGNTALDEVRTTKKERLERKGKLSEAEEEDFAIIEKALTDIDWGKQKAWEILGEHISDAVRHNDFNSLLALDAIGLDLKKSLEKQQTLLIDALKDGNLNIAELLIKHGADPLVKGDEGRTPFLMAVYKGYLDLAGMIHEKGADPNDIPWGAPYGILQLVYEESKGDLKKILPFLTGTGADVNWRNKDGRTPLHIAAKNDDAWFFELLIKNGANPRLRDSDGKTPFDLVPVNSRSAFMKIQAPVWQPKSTFYTSTITALETAKENREWINYERNAQELISYNDPIGYYAMGSVYHNGTGRDIDYKIALDYFRKGPEIAIGDPDLFYMMGVYNEFGLGGLAKNDRAALEWYEKSAKKGSLEAGYRIGKMALEGRGMDKNLYKGFVYIQSSAVQDEGFPEAIHTLGVLYEKGLGVEKNTEMAETLYKEAKERGYSPDRILENTINPDTADIKKKLADAYDKLVKGRDDVSMSYIQGLAQKGNSLAQQHMGQMYYFGRGGHAVNYTTALDWFHKAAQKNQAMSMDFLGYMYEAGQGTAKDPVKSFFWYIEAAAGGNTHAQYILGVIFLEGKDSIPKDYNRALSYFKSAAEKGHASAQDYLGWMYEQGYGVEKSLTKAKEWYKKAADQGNEEAEKSLARLR